MPAAIPVVGLSNSGGVHVSADVDFRPHVHCRFCRRFCHARVSLAATARTRPAAPLFSDRHPPGRQLGRTVDCGLIAPRGISCCRHLRLMHCAPATAHGSVTSVSCACVYHASLRQSNHGRRDLADLCCDRHFSNAVLVVAAVHSLRRPDQSGLTLSVGVGTCDPHQPAPETEPRILERKIA
jgi:hypothetical protein